MARHKKHRTHIKPGAPTLAQRAQRALDEKRFSHARELALSLVHQLDTPEHRDLLVRAGLGRAYELLAENRLSDAANVLAGIFRYVETPNHLAAAAEALARSGDLPRAKELADKAGDAQLSRRLVGLAVDADLRDRGRGHVPLPAELVPQRDLIRQAFVHLQNGADEQVAATLQGIGLASPYLEWKLLLRGLLAYYQNDDARAVENWQRLRPDRLPFRLAAPFRAALDNVYRQAQAPETQRSLATQLERLQGGGLADKLRHVQPLLAGRRSLSQAFRQVEGVVSAMKTEAPHLVPRLAACLFWAIIDHGLPEDVQRFQRVFGAPPEDPRLWRLEALALEHRMELEPAHDAWKKYEQSLASKPDSFPAGHVQRMRALIWQHMGNNAAMQPDAPDPASMPFGMFGMMPPKPLQPSAEECFAKSLELVPDLLGSHLALIHHYLDNEKSGKALQAAKRLLKQIPEHVPTLTIAGDLSLEKGHNQEALEFFTRALQANPLDARLRRRLCAAQVAAGSEQVEQGNLEHARQSFQTARGLAEAEDRPNVLASWAACEFKAGMPERAEELLQEVSAAGQPLAVAFQMLVCAIRFRLSKPLKTRFEKDFNRLLAEPPQIAAAVALAHYAAGLARAGTKYVGQKGHEKKVIAYINKSRDSAYDEGQLLRLCAALQDLKSVRLLQNFFHAGQSRFPNNPRFYVAEAQYLLTLPRHRVQPFKVKQLLVRARELAAALPGTEREPLLQQVQECEELLREMNPFGSFMDAFNPEMLFGFQGEGDDGDFDEEDDDDDAW